MNQQALQGYLRTTASNSPEDIANWAARVGRDSWIILESYPAVTFKALRAGEALPEMGAEFAGRIFGEKAELRWVREGSSFNLWLLEDAGEPGEFTTLFRIVERNYYGLGYWSEKEGFWEPKLRRGQVEYPLDKGVDEDRPRFRVFEYYRTPPKEWPSNLDELEDLLNQPSLAAYRLVGFDAGRDGK